MLEHDNIDESYELKKERDQRRLDLLREMYNRLKSQESLYEFVKQGWRQIEGDRPFSEGWHIGAICEHLEAVTYGTIKNLLINVPPRTSKSSIISVMWPAWTWIVDPSSQFLFASYAASLSTRDSVKCRRLIMSPWYQNRWGGLYELVGDQNTKTRFENNKTGYRIATSVGGAATGEGGQFLVCDDPNSAREDNSETKRTSANDWFDTTWSTRLNDPKNGAMVVVQQRINEKDVTGHILSKEDVKKWAHLMLPMRFESSRRSKTTILPSSNGKIWEDPRKTEGELLWPSHYDEDGVKRLEQALGSVYNIAGQLQQRPSPGIGGIIKKDWFPFWKENNPPKVSHVIQSWDTALTAADDNCYSACLTFGLFKDDNYLDNLILLNLWRGKVEYPELRKVAKMLANNYLSNGKEPCKANGKHMPDVILVEAKASGLPLIQDMRKAGILATKFQPKGDKIERVRIITHILENGRVWLPALGPDFTRLRGFADLFREQCAMFPKGESRDVVDCLTQAIQRLMNGGWLSNSTDDRDETIPKPKNTFYSA